MLETASSSGRIGSKLTAQAKMRAVLRLNVSSCNPVGKVSSGRNGMMRVEGDQSQVKELH
jgi:hypothetical protein